jgi:integrase
MRAHGHIFHRGKIWYIAYSFRGHPYQESSRSTERKDAEKLLRQRLREVHKPNFVDPSKQQRWTLDDMLEQIRLDYERKQNRSYSGIKFAFQHLQEGFKFHRVIDITGEKVEQYRDKRLQAGAARASVNRELAALRRGYKLMLEKRMISEAPVIKLLEGENVRQGFLSVGDFYSLLEKIENQDVRDIIEFLYNSGWRSVEAKKLQWSWLDGKMIRLPKEFAKNKKSRALPLTGALLDIIERRKAKRRPDCNYVFHRAGKTIKSFRRAFKAAAKEVKMPDLLPHDMRRSAVRNFRRSGLSEHEGMALSGHKTDSVYRRYDIIADDDLTAAMERVQQHVKKEAENRKVVPLKRESA